MIPITISGTGVCVLDLLFNDVDLSGEAIKPYLSRIPGDGGIEPGKMTLGESLEKYSGNRDVQTLLKEICVKSEPDYINLGGVAIATLIHASQLLDHHNFELYYYGSIGDDGIGVKVRSMISRTQVKHDSLSPLAGETCSTIVLFDPRYGAGQGERSFIYFPNRMRYSRTNLDKRFFSSDITLFAGTENYPDIYENFTSLLKQCKENGCVTFVETSYDSYSESKNPGQKWIMGDSDDCYHYIDILAMNRDEALKHSGRKTSTMLFPILKEAEHPVSSLPGAHTLSTSIQTGSCSKKKKDICRSQSESSKSSIMGFCHGATLSVAVITLWEAFWPPSLRRCRTVKTLNCAFLKPVPGESLRVLFHSPISAAFTWRRIQERKNSSWKLIMNPIETRYKN